MDIREWALSRFTPVVMVMATPQAEAVCQEKNGLSVTDMLRPYGAVHNISVPVRTVGEQTYRINSFKLRLHEASTIFQPKFEVAEAHLAQTLSNAAEECGGHIYEDMAEIRSAVSMRQDMAPWFSVYRREMLRLLSFTDFETFDHPVACLFVADSDGDNMETCFKQLDMPEKYPWLMQHGVMEPNILKNYLLLCDTASGSLGKAEMNLEKIRRVHGTNNCHLLKINSGSGKPSDSGGVASLWRSCFNACIAGGGAGEPESRVEDPDLGLHLTAADLEGIALVMRDFTVRSLLPFLEARIRALNHQITATRRGIKNSLKALWWRKERTAEDMIMPHDKSPAAAAGMYGYSSAESQMRYLSDLSFMVHDFGLAASTLRLLQSDFKADKAMRHFAGSQEMLALCVVMLDEGSTREAEDCFTQAYQAYMQSGPEYGRYATRAMLHLADLYKIQGRYREAKSSLMRAHFEEGHVRAALLLEQAAECLLLCDPPMERKFIFHIVLAGLRYHQCEQRVLAERAYSQVLKIYGGRGWGLIEEHLHDILCRYTQDKADVKAAVTHTMALVSGSAHRSEAVQAQYMKQFCETVKECERLLKAKGQEDALPLALELPLPTVAAASAVVHVDGVRYMGNAAAVLVEDPTWERLHESLSPGGLVSALGGSNSSNWLAARVGGSQDDLLSNVCCANEAIGVDIELSNPLDITLQVDKLGLVCELEPSRSGAASSSGDPLDPEPNEASLFVSIRQKVTLRAKEKSKIRLRVRPLVPGLLRVMGVEWCVNGAVLGRRLFPQHSGPRWKGDVSHQRLSFSVISAMPKMLATLHGLSNTLYAGELQRCFLEIRNESDIELKNIRIAVDHPEEILVASSAATAGADTKTVEEGLQAEASSPQSWEAAAVEGASAMAQLQPLPVPATGEVPAVFVGSCPRVWRLPTELTLAKGKVQYWPMWVSPKRIGTTSFQLAIYFEKKSTTGMPSSMRHRVLCMSHSLSVVPALKINTHVQLDPSQLHRSLCRMQLHNYPESNDAFVIRQVSCVSPHISLSCLRSKDGQEPKSGFDLRMNESVGVGETNSIFVHVQKDQRESSGRENHAPSSVAAVPVNRGVLEWFNSCSVEAQRSHNEFQTRLSRKLLEATDVADGSKDPDGESGHGNASADNRLSVPQEAGATLCIVWEVKGVGRVLRLGSSLVQTHPAAEAAQSSVSPSEPGGIMPLRAVLKGPRVLVHDFKKAPMCEVPLKLMVANQLQHITAVHIDCATPEDPSLPGAWHLSESAGLPPDSSQGQIQGQRHQAGLAPSHPWRWCGQSQLTLAPLETDCSGDVELRVAVMAPGRYVIAGYQLMCTQEDLRTVSYSAMGGPPCMLTILHEPIA